MRLIISKKADVNYLAKVVQIDNFRKHSNPEVERLKCCTVDGFNIITGIDSEAGLYVYFPIMSKINPDFLRYANLYRHEDLNSEPGKKGMFEDNGRVKSINLKGEKSEGFILPFVVLQNWIVSVTNKDLTAESGTEFDSVEDGDKSFWVCKKYIVRTHERNNPAGGYVRHKVKKELQDKVIPSQFRFHYDTLVLRKVPFYVQPEDTIHISTKIHGTSHISANVLCRKEKLWWTPIYKWITEKIFKQVYNDTKYDNLYSSRTVIKNKFYNKGVSKGFYNEDIWKFADDIIRPKLPKGYTAYAEIVGFLPNGNYIQKGYDYGCTQPKASESYTHEKHFKVRIYRITITNPDGVVYELTPTEVHNWCELNGLVSVKELYLGKAKDLYGVPEDMNDWNNFFIDHLANDKNFYMEEDSPDCKNKVPHEGIVIKVIGKNSSAVKLKCFRFLQKEERDLDKGVENIEDNA